MSLKAITANRLIDGIAVWLTPTGRWSESVYDARVAEDADSLAAMEAIAAQATKACTVVDALPIDVKMASPSPPKTRNAFVPWVQPYVWIWANRQTALERPHNVPV